MPKAGLSKTKSPMELFDYLAKEEEIAPDDLEILKQVLRDIKRPELLQKVAEFENYGMVMDYCYILLESIQLFSLF